VRRDPYPSGTSAPICAVNYAVSDHAVLEYTYGLPTQTPFGHFGGVDSPSYGVPTEVRAKDMCLSSRGASRLTVGLNGMMPVLIVEQQNALIALMGVVSAVMINGGIVIIDRLTIGAGIFLQIYRCWSPKSEDNDCDSR
jgi:hypothetical protein